MSPAQLLAEIQSGPLAATLAPLAESGADAAVADALNAPGPDSLPRSLVPRGELLAAMVSANAYPLLRAAKDGDGPFSSLAFATLTLLTDPASSLDFTLAETAQQLAGLDAVAPGLGAALSAIGSRPASRAEVTGGAGYRVGHAEVSAALISTREAGGGG